MAIIRNILLLCIAAAATVPAQGESATDTTSMEKSLYLEEVSITAIKTSRNLSNDALSASTFSKRLIERNNVLSAKDFAKFTPNLHIPNYGSRMTSSIYVRGIGARIDQPAVGLNIDNLPVMNKDNYDFNINDIARAEILRGPQSTLYGRNAMGGIINIYTLSPLSYQGTRAMVQYGSGNSYQIAVSHYRLIGDNKGLSISGSFSSSDGFFTNIYNGKKCDWEKNGSIRSKFEWHRGSTSIDNTLSASISRQGGYPYISTEGTDVAYNDTCFYRRTSIADAFTVKWNWKGINMSSISSYQFIDDNMTLDQDFLPYSYFTLSQIRREHVLTEDLIAKYKHRDYNALLGFFAFYRHSDMDAPVTFLDDGIAQLIEKNRNNANADYPIVWQSREFPLYSNFVMQSYGIAAYHQSTYNLGRFRFTAGIRLDYERSCLDYRSHCNSGYDVIDMTGPTPTLYRHQDVIISDNGSLSQDFLQLLPKFSVSYFLGNARSSSIYASIGKGYKAGGFNNQMFSDVLQQKVMSFMGLAAPYDVREIVTYKPETSWNYELGTHLSLLDGKITADASAFFIRISNQQLTAFPEGTVTGRIMTNAGKSRSYGVEASLNVNPFENFGIIASYGYTNVKFSEYHNGKSDFSGNFAPYVPMHTMYAGANYSLNLNNCRFADCIEFESGVRGTGKIYWDENNDHSQPFYALLHASITLKARHYSVQIWGNNITDSKHSVFWFTSIGNSFEQRGEKAKFGATLRLNI